MHDRTAEERHGDVVLKVKGMRAPRDGDDVAAALRSVAGVTRAEVSFGEQRARVLGTPAWAELLEAVKKQPGGADQRPGAFDASVERDEREVVRRRTIAHDTGDNTKLLIDSKTGLVIDFSEAPRFDHPLTRMDLAAALLPPAKARARARARARGARRAARDRRRLR